MFEDTGSFFSWRTERILKEDDNYIDYDTSESKSNIKQFLYCTLILSVIGTLGTLLVM